MGFPPEALQEFMAAYRADFGEDITEAEAREMATRLLTLCEALARPLPSELKQFPKEDL